jgi:phospholipase/carboxylesterase
MSELTGGQVDVRLRPAAGQPGGALILNHGRGADENDLFGLLEELDPERRLLGITTGAPFTGIAPGGRHWYIVERVGFPDAQTFHYSCGLLAERLDAILAEHSLDWSSTVIGGFSQGTVMSYATALGPERPTPAAILAFSGFIPEVDGWVPQLQHREGLRVLVHHGLNDAIIGADFGRRAAQVLGAAGIEVEWLETDAGHWLPAQVLGPARATIAAALGLAGGVEA